MKADIEEDEIDYKSDGGEEDVGFPLELYSYKDNSTNKRLLNIDIINKPELWKAKVVYGERGEFVRSKSALVTIGKPESFDIKIDFKMRKTKKKIEQKRTLDLVITFNNNTIVSVIFSEDNDNFMETMGDSGSHVWIQKEITSSIYSNVILVKKTPYYGVSNVIFVTNAKDMRIACSKIY